MASNFDKLAQSLAGKPGVTNPAGLAAVIGRKKYGANVMAKASSKGMSAASVKRGPNDNDADDRRR